MALLPKYQIAILALYLIIQAGNAKPIEMEEDDSADTTAYKDTEEIINDWNNEDSYFYDETENSARHPEPKITYLPPAFVEHVMPSPSTSTTSATTTSTTTPKPVYLPRTDIELGSLFDRIGQARRREVEGPVDLPVPYIVWVKNPSGQKNNANYYKELYNSVYSVE